MWKFHWNSTASYRIEIAILQRPIRPVIVLHQRWVDTEVSWSTSSPISMRMVCSALSLSLFSSQPLMNIIFEMKYNVPKGWINNVNTRNSTDFSFLFDLKIEDWLYCMMIPLASLTNYKQTNEFLRVIVYSLVTFSITSLSLSIWYPADCF